MRKPSTTTPGEASASWVPPIAAPTPTNPAAKLRALRIAADRISDPLVDGVLGALDDLDRPRLSTPTE